MTNLLSKLISIACLTIFTASTAYAEYYVAYGPRVTVVCGGSTSCYKKHRVKHIKYRPCMKKHRYARVHKVYHSRCKVYSPCSACNSCASRCYSHVRSTCGYRAYTRCPSYYSYDRCGDYTALPMYREIYRPNYIYNEADEYSFDRRTADDIGPEMNIDY